MFTALEVQNLFCFVLVFIYLFLAALSLHCCVQALSAFSGWGLLFVMVHRLLLLQSTGSGRSGFRGCVSWAPEHRLRSCGTGASLP